MTVKNRRKALRYISLFSGIGALDLAVRNVLGAETEAYVEIDKFCQKVLKARIKDGYLDDAEIFNDIKEFKWKKTDMVVGGFPCQPFSNAGARKGEADDRNMWPDTLRVIRMARPEYVFLENVPGLLSGDDEGRQPYVYTILADLAEEGFDAEWEIIGVDDAGASHRRKRWFCFAYRKLADSDTYVRFDLCRSKSEQAQKTQPWISKRSCLQNKKLADTGSERQERICGTSRQGKRSSERSVGGMVQKLADSDSSGYIHRESEIDSDKRRIDALGDTSHSCDELADSESRKSWKQKVWDRGQSSQRGSPKLADTEDTGDCTLPYYPPGPSDSSGWEYLLSIMPEIEPAFCRILDDGKMANRMDRLKALGNAVAWQAGAIALRLCIERSGVLDGAES